MADEKSTVEPTEDVEVEGQEPETEAPKVEKPESDVVLDTLVDKEPEPNKDEEEKEEGEKETNEESDDEGTPEPEQEEDKEEEDPKEKARRGYEERQRIREERIARINQQGEGYIAEAEDDTAKRLRTLEVQEYQRIVEHNEDTLINEFERVKANPTLQIFNPDSKDFNQKAYDKALKDYNAGYLEYDQNGNMIGIKGSLYQHLTETADLLQGAIKSGQIKQVRDGRKMSGSADTKPAASPKEVEKDTILDVLKSD